MSEFHYVRTLGVDGGVDACEGPAIGLDLETVLGDGLPPWNISLEIIAAICEILDISEQDGEVHGDLHPKYVFIDETGAVSLEGFGVPRKKTRAPESVPRGPRTDLYGLGYTAYRATCSTDLPERLPDDDPDAHDDAVIDYILDIDLDGLPEEMQGDIQWFVAKLMSFDREDRPPALEAWRTFIAFASETDGPEMAGWCAAALDGGGARRTDGGAPSGHVPDPDTTDEEELEGPVKATGPLAGRPTINFDDGANSGKGATAFWTKEDMKKALERQATTAQEPEEGPPMGVGGGEATSFWSRDQLAAMKAGESGAPRPRRAEGQGERRRATAQLRPPTAIMRRPGSGTVPPPDPPTLPLPENQPATVPPDQGGRSRPAVSSSPRTPAASTQPPPQAPPKPPPHVAAGGTATPIQAPSSSHSSRAPAPAPAPAPPAEDEGGGGGIFVLLFGGGVAAAGGVVVGVVLLILLLVGAWWWMATPQVAVQPVPAPTLAEQDLDDDDDSTEAGTDVGDDGTEPSPKPSPTTRPKPSPSPTTRPEPSPSPSPSPKPSPAPTTRPKPSPSPRPTPSPSPRPSPRPSPSPSPAPAQPVQPAPAAPVLAEGDARVGLRTTGRGTVTCGGSAVDFDGPRAFVIEGYQLPATCLVQIEGARQVFQVYGTGDVTCEKQGGAVQCDKQQVP